MSGFVLVYDTQYPIYTFCTDVCMSLCVSGEGSLYKQINKSLSIYVFEYVCVCVYVCLSVSVSECGYVCMCV